jgi:hypothetical protein
MFSTVRDHEEIDAMLAAIVNASTPIDELPVLLDAVQRALAMHAEVEGKILDRLPPPARTFAIRMQLDHSDLSDAMTALARVPAGSSAWYVQAFELRELFRDHAGAALIMVTQLSREISEPTREALAREYAEERERIVGDGSLPAAARRSG